MRFEISFKADLSPEKKELLELHFADTLKLMGIEPEELSIALRAKSDPVPAIAPAAVQKPSLDELLDTLSMQHFADVTKCFEACKSKSDIAKVIKAAPAMFGTFWAEYDGSDFTIVNRFFDDELGCDWETEYWYDYPKDWKED